MFGYEPEYIDCGDARIACYDIGRGHPLILLHGNGEDSSYWNAQISEFTRFMRVIAVDSRGHGASDSGTKGLSFELMAQDLKHILDVKGIKKAFFLGFSDGGNLAIKFALQWPDMVEKLVLNGANIDPSGVRRSVQAPIEIGYAMARRFAARSEKARANAEMLGLMVNEPHIPPETLSALTMPVLVLAGTRDMVKRRHTEQIAASLPNAQLQFLNGDHFLAAKEPAAFNEAVLRFLQEA